MRKILPILLTASLVVACQDQEPIGVPDGGPIAFDISDGATDGPIDEFFFLPPLADNPSGNSAFDDGEFNQYLQPVARICELDYDLRDLPDDRPPVPSCTGSFEAVLPMELGGNKQYTVNWKTGDFLLQDSVAYRIHVYVGSEEFGTLGYRDVIPLPNPNTASWTAPNSFCQINNGSNVPIKVWIGENAFCASPGTCQTKSFDLANGVSFDLEIFDPVDPETFLLNVPAQTSQQGTVTFQECAVDNTASLIDLPVFGPCLETVLLSGEPIDLDDDATATISFCDIDIDSLGLAEGLPEGQEENLRVHHFRGVNGEDGVEALRVANDCPEPTASLPSSPIERFASRILSWITPRPLQAAAVAGRGGFGGNSLETIGSKFRIALPAKIDFVNPADALRVAPAGDVLPTQAQVTDLNGEAVAGATVRWNVTEGAGTVAPVLLPPPTSDAVCEVGAPGDPDAVVCTTGASGEVEVDWTIASAPGVNKLTAGGRGIADPRVGEVCSDISGDALCNGPRDISYPATDPDYPNGAFDPFQPIAWTEKDNDGIDSAGAERSEPIAQGTRLLFTAIGCELGFGTPNDIDGVMEDGEWDCAIQEPFPVNLSGGSTVQAKLYYMNDEFNFHLAVVVPGTGRVNGLRVEWDDNPPDGVTEGDHYQAARNIGDDVWEYEPEDDAKADKFIDDKCSTSSQSSCGNNDADFITTPDVVGMNTGADFNNLGDQTVYEMSHPLSTGQVCEVFGRKGCSSGFSIDLQAAKGQTKGAFITLRLGRGAQGNTQWPGFLEYLTIEIK